MDTDPQTPHASSLLSPQDPRWLVSLALREAVTNAERRFALLRGGFCITVGIAFLVQALLAGGNGKHLNVTAGQIAVEASTVLLGVSFSGWILVRTSGRAITRLESLLSVLFDAALCTLALAGNQFAEPEAYQGVLSSMDVAAAPMVTMTSVLRVSKVAVLASGAAMSAGIAGLIFIDLMRGLPPAPDKVLLFFVYQGATIALASFITSRAKEIFERVGRAAARAEHARGSLVALLSDHHDVRSDVCDIQLGVDLLGEALRQGSGKPDEASRVETLCERLECSVKRLSDRTSDTRGRALSALEGGAAPAPADPGKAIRSSSERFVETHPEISLQVTLPEEPPALPPVLACGGTGGLTRILEHLLINGYEGDGKCGARAMQLSATRLSRTLVQITLSDDGPGLPARLIDAKFHQPTFSTKPGSLGIGLRLTESLVSAAAGRLLLSNSEPKILEGGRATSTGGARVRLNLRVAGRTS